MFEQPRKEEPQAEVNPEDQFEVPDGTAAFYCDSIHLNTGVWGSTIYLGELRPGRKPVLRAKVKVSPQMLRAISLLTRKHLRDYETRIGPVSLPGPLIHSWGIEEEVQ